MLKVSLTVHSPAFTAASRMCVTRRKLQTPGIAEEHKIQETPTINPIGPTDTHHRPSTAKGCVCFLMNSWFTANHDQREYDHGPAASYACSAAGCDTAYATLAATLTHSSSDQLKVMQRAAA